MIPEINAQTLKKQLDENISMTLIDVREPCETRLCAIPGSINIPLDQLADHLDSLPIDQQIVMICHHGNRSKKGALLLSHCGFDNVFNFSGGVDSWALNIDRSMKRY